jgi:hypothetical protein
MQRLIAITHEARPIDLPQPNILQFYFACAECRPTRRTSSTGSDSEVCKPTGAELRPIDAAA